MSAGGEFDKKRWPLDLEFSTYIRIYSLNYEVIGLKEKEKVIYIYIYSCPLPAGAHARRTGGLLCIPSNATGVAARAWIPPSWHFAFSWNAFHEYSMYYCVNCREPVHRPTPTRLDEGTTGWSFLATQQQTHELRRGGGRRSWFVTPDLSYTCLGKNSKEGPGKTTGRGERGILSKSRIFAPLGLSATRSYSIPLLSVNGHTPIVSNVYWSEYMITAWNFLFQKSIASTINCFLGPRVTWY